MPLFAGPLGPKGNTRSARWDVAIGGGGGPSLFDQMKAANPPILFYAGALDGVFQERTGAGATTPSAVDQAVGSWKNFGSLGGWATTTSDPARPILRLVSGKYRLATDGIDDFLRILFTQSQPFVRVSANAPISNIPVNGQVFGGGVSQAAVLFNNSGQLGIYSGTILAGPSMPTSPFLAEERHSGATSRLKLNNGAYTTADAGSAVSGGTTFGNNYALNAPYASLGIYACVAWVGSEPSANDLALARAFCSDAAGL